MVTKESAAFVDSNVTSHFTNALVLNASEYEDLDLTGTGGVGGEARCFVSSLRLISTQNLAWVVGFHNKDNTAPGTDTVISHLLNQNTMIDFWSFATTDAIAVGSAFVYAVSGMKIPYRDDEGTGRLHVSLHNRSTTAKIAGAGGEVQMRIGVIGAA